MGEVVLSFALIVFCLICLVNLIFGMGTMVEYDPMGPIAWPAVLIVLLLVMLTANIVLAFRKKAAAAEGGAWSWPGIRAVLTHKLTISIVLLFAYAFLLDNIGFLFSTPLFILAYTTLLGQKSWKVRIIAAFAATIVLYLLFSRLLQVPLPRGYGVFREISLFVELV